MTTLTHEQLGLEVATWFGIWTGVLVACYLVSAALFPSFAKLDTTLNSKGKKTDEKLWWAACMMSTIHASYIAYVALGRLFGDGGMAGPSNFQEDLYGTDPLVIDNGPIFLGYIFLDTVLTFWCWNSWPGTGANLIHHVCCIASFWQCITGGYGHFYCMYAWVMETTTPFVNQRWFFDKSGMKGGLLFKINGLTMVFLWIILRIGWYGYAMFYGPWRQSIDELDAWRSTSMLTIQVAGYWLQWMWGYKIVMGAAKAVGLIKPTPKKE